MSQPGAPRKPLDGTLSRLPLLLGSRRKVSLSDSGAASRSLGSVGGSQDIKDIIGDAKYELVQRNHQFLRNLVESSTPDELVDTVEAMLTDLSDALEQLGISFTAAAAARELPADSCGPEPKRARLDPATCHGGQVVDDHEEWVRSGAASQYDEEMAAGRTAGDE